jgi:glyoxylase-like metal-dependent hydrolase (beta-lactamase superfamily II)
MSDVHEIYAIRYGHHQRRSSENFIGGDPHDVMSSINYFVWVIKGAHGIFVVDTGMDEAMAKKRGRTVDKPIAEGLRALGIAPGEIANVVLTHLHFDHAGNYDLFPRARYHLQDTEMAYATGRCMCHALQRWPFDVEDVVAIVRKVFADRVEFHDGDDELAPGITLHKIGGHSKGLQCVRVKTRRGPVVLASDATHLYAHIEQGRVFPVTYNVGDVLEGYKTIKRLAPSMNHVVPGHDPLVLERFPAARAGLENWVARIDADPR